MFMAALVSIVAASLAPDASRAAVVTNGGMVRTWINGAVMRADTSPVPVGVPAAAALSGDVVRVLWVAEGVFRLYEYAPETPERYHTVPAPPLVRALALSPSGHAAVVACGDGTLRGLDVRAWEFGWTVATGEIEVLAVAMASDGGPVVAAFADGAVRRYDLGAGTSDIVGAGTAASAVAITPDGEVVVTAAGGGLYRWDWRTGAPPKIRPLDAVITALAVDGTGNQVLAGADNGKVWLHDLTGGPDVEYIIPAGAPPVVPARAAQPSPAVPDRAAALSARPLIDDDVRFTVYRPQVLAAGRWALLLVFVHKTSLVEESGRAPIDPQKQVEALARHRFAGAPPRPAGEDARAGLMRGAQLRIVPDLPGIRCNPKDAEVEWWEPVHEVSFRLLAGPELAGTAVRGTVRVWCGAVILAEVSIAIHVAADGPIAEAPPVEEPVRRYRKIFASYSHRDREIVANYAEAYRAIGDQYLQDVLVLRSGERWNARVLELIEDADVFQLFWSRNSMRSRHCRDEWEHALALPREEFVKPIYWEEPIPEDLENELPPAALRALHFARVPVVVPRPQDSVPAGSSAPARQARRDAPDDVGFSRAAPVPVSPAAGPPAVERAAAPPEAADERDRAPQSGDRRSRTRWPLVGGLAAAAAAVLLLVGVYAADLHHSSSPPPAAAAPSVNTTIANPAPAGPTAQFTGLHDGSKVSFIQKVSGQVVDIPPLMDIWLVVRPVGAATYQPQPGPLHPDVDGLFDGVAVFGHSPTQNRGERFILMIVEATPSASQYLELFAGSHPQGASLPALPDGTQILTQITVQRS